MHHRHISNLYGLFPADEISLDRTPALAKAAKTTLERRGDESVGWATAWRACWWARLRDGDHAWKVLKMLFHPVTDTSVAFHRGPCACGRSLFLDECDGSCKAL